MHGGLCRIVDAGQMAHEIELHGREIRGFRFAGEDHGPLHDPFAVGLENSLHPGARLPAPHPRTEGMELGQVDPAKLLREPLHEPSHQGEVVVDPDEGDKVAGHPLEPAVEHDEAFPVDRPLGVHIGQIRPLIADRHPLRKPDHPLARPRTHF